MWILPDQNETFTNYFGCCTTAANSEEWNDDELDLYESIFSAIEQMPRSVWMLVRALKLY